ncbi:MAG: GNAT family N-acetyltransferase, partial [Betaproteobacteria bacterium]|nr:GNAT family N-acetyltransferase [Betaproteobacteria bacterium]
MLTWQFSRFDQLPIRDWYAVSTLRIDVFVMEQNCPFQDNDGADFDSWHLLGWHDAGDARELVAYCRIVDAGIKYEEPSIGRVVTAQNVRREGYGKILMAEALRRHDALYPGVASRIGAQQRLERFYQGFGYETVSDAYIEDGIPHVVMVRGPPAVPA